MYGLVENNSQQKELPKIEKSSVELKKNEIKEQKNIQKELENEIQTKKTTLQIGNNQYSLKFKFNDEYKMSVVQIFKKDTTELLREFPSEEFFNRMKFFKEEILPGLLLNEKA